jgi:outer membrane protein assembly factor BamD (BamD/ComL family)
VLAPTAVVSIAPHPSHAPVGAASVTNLAPDAGAPVRRDDDGLRRERAMLEIARTALGRGDAASALDALARHADEYPDGKLSEERDAMTIQSLVAAGRGAGARERADTFRRRYPRSLLLPSIDRA